MVNEIPLDDLVSYCRRSMEDKYSRMIQPAAVENNNLSNIVAASKPNLKQLPVAPALLPPSKSGIPGSKMGASDLNSLLTSLTSDSNSLQSGLAKAPGPRYPPQPQPQVMGRVNDGYSLFPK